MKSSALDRKTQNPYETTSVWEICALNPLGKTNFINAFLTAQCVCLSIVWGQSPTIHYVVKIIWWKCSIESSSKQRYDGQGNSEDVGQIKWSASAWAWRAQTKSEWENGTSNGRIAQTITWNTPSPSSYFWDSWTGGVTWILKQYSWYCFTWHNLSPPPPLTMRTWIWWMNKTCRTLWRYIKLLLQPPRAQQRMNSIEINEDEKKSTA